jgi:DNA-binding XRE family transcriptional regulator
MAYGMLVEERRAKLGMTRNDLAARIGTPPTTIASIEEGYLPTAKIRNQLAVALNGEPSSQIRRAASEPLPRGRLRRPRLPVGAGWFLGGLPILSILIAGGLAVGAMLVGGQLSGGDGALPVQRLVAVSSGLGPPVSIHRARVQAQNAAAAEARRAAEKRRERAAAAAAAAAAGNAAAKEAHRGTPTQTQPVTQPVAPSPAPSGGGGGGGGGSSGGGDAPSLQHGIGVGG